MKFSKTALLVIAACAAVLSGCSSTDPREPVDLKRIDPVTVDTDRVWRKNVDDSITGLLVPAVTHDAVYAAGDDTIYRFDPESGDRVWKARTENEITAGVGTDGHYVAVGTTAGEMEVFDKDGKKLWKVRLTSEMACPPLIGSGFIIVRTADTRVSAYDAATGERRWRYQGNSAALTLRAFSQMKFSPAGVLIGQANGKLLALNARGEVVFDIPVAQPSGITEVERLIDVVGAPHVDANMMCAAAFQGGVLCMNSQNGNLLWRAKVDAVTGPVSDGRNLYIVSSKGEIHAYDCYTGKQVWVNKDLLYRSPSAPGVIGDKIVVGDFDGEMHVIDTRDGRIVGRRSISGAVRVPPVPIGTDLLIQSAEGDLCRFHVEPRK